MQSSNGFKRRVRAMAPDGPSEGIKVETWLIQNVPSNVPSARLKGIAVNCRPALWSAICRGAAGSEVDRRDLIHLAAAAAVKSPNSPLRRNAGSRRQAPLISPISAMARAAYEVNIPSLSAEGLGLTTVTAAPRGAEHRAAGKKYGTYRIALRWLSDPCRHVHTSAAASTFLTIDFLKCARPVIYRFSVIPGRDNSITRYNGIIHRFDVLAQHQFRGGVGNRDVKGAVHFALI